MNLAAPHDVSHAGSEAPPYEAVLKRLSGLHPQRIDLSLERLRRLLNKLGHPETRLPPVLHVAGTNGKGSTIAYLRAALEASGRRVHVLTSPHLIRINETIRLNGRLISDEELSAVLQACEHANAGEPVTGFEATTAAAFLAFRDNPADILLLECGMGGRLDATNVIERPLLTAITTVSRDHQDFLGASLVEIAGEKAGILKPGVPGVINWQVAAAADVIEDRAAALGVRLSRQDQEWRVTARDGALCFRSDKGVLQLPMPALAGLHQVQNAGLALACLQNLLGFSVSMANMAAGLSKVHWPGRLQRLRQGPLYDQLVPDGELWLGSGHNPGAGEALAQTMQDWQARDETPRRLHLIMGMLRNKDAAGFLAPFRTLAPKLHAVGIADEGAAMAPGDIVRAARGQGLDAAPVDGVADALARIMADCTGSAAPRVLICGTLHLVGSVLATDPQDELKPA